MAIDSTRTTDDPVMAEILAEFGDRAFHPGDPSEDGSGDSPLINGMVLELMALMAKLKTRRASMGLTIAQIARRSRLSVEVIERLEEGRVPNPHFDLVWRYALAMDALPTLSIEEVEPGAEELEDRERE